MVSRCTALLVVDKRLACLFYLLALAVAGRVWWLSIRTKPRLRLALGKGITHVRVADGQFATVRLVGIEVKNEPRATRGGTAAVVTPHLVFVDAYQRTLKFQGRWADSELPLHQDRHIGPMEIPAGAARKLDVAIRFEDGAMFAVGNNSHAFGYRAHVHQLTPPVGLRVEFTGDPNVAWDFTIAIDENGAPELVSR